MSESNDNIVKRFKKQLSKTEGVQVLYCPARLFNSLKGLSDEHAYNVYQNSHKCVFMLNKKTHLTEIKIVPNSYSYKLIRTVKNANAKEENIQSINRLSKEMDRFTMCLQSMFYLGIVSTNRDIGILIRGIRRLAKTLNIKYSTKKEYILQCFSEIITILESINL